MLVVMLGEDSATVGMLARALSRMLDAAVIEGDRLAGLRGVSPGSPGWIDALTGAIGHGRARPHTIAACRPVDATGQARLFARCPDAVIVGVRATELYATASDSSGGQTMFSWSYADAESGASRLCAWLLSRDAREAAPLSPAMTADVSSGSG